jgi:hypothetical protein
LIAIGVLKEKVQLYHIAGGFMTLIGVAVTQVKLSSLQWRGLRYKENK